MTSRNTPGHTPGPWKKRESEREPGSFYVEDKDWLVAHVSGRSSENEANANLIAAAPDLLTALEFFIEQHIALVNSGDCGNGDAETDQVVIRARAALKKARGQ